MALAMPQHTVHAAAIVGLFSEALQSCHGSNASTPAPTQALVQNTPRPKEASPGAMHWVLAVVLIIVLVSGLIRVFRVLHADSVAPMRHIPEGMRPVECGACRMMQYVTNHDRIFICFSCRSANRIPVDTPRSEQQELVAPTGPLRKFEFKKGGENFWQELKQEELEEVPPEVAGQAEATAGNCPTVVGRQMETDSNTSSRTMDNGLPQCVVCLDSPGCMVLLPCAHGSVCEECVSRIVQNRASGGAHCPHCRSNIKTLVKINELDGDIAQGIEYRIPMARPL